jgi:tRNA G10  N-methylase Trm11
LALLLRIILTSTKVGDTVLDPFAGTGTTPVVSLQTQRNSISIEIDPANIDCIKSRLTNLREADVIQKYYRDYVCTANLPEIWGEDFSGDMVGDAVIKPSKNNFDFSLFEAAQ